jgi:hypothetical protein
MPNKFPFSKPGHPPDLDGHYSFFFQSGDALTTLFESSGFYGCPPRAEVCEGQDAAATNTAQNNRPSQDAAQQAQQPAQTQPAAHTEPLVAAQDAARNNPANQPEPNGGRTFCNIATYQTAVAVGAPLGPLSNNNPQARGTPAATANEIANNLAHSNQYHRVSAEEAQQIANRGGLVIGVQPHPGHGHVATVRPNNLANEHAPAGGRGPTMNNVGRTVGVLPAQGPAGNRAFRNDSQPVYYAPN